MKKLFFVLLFSLFISFAQAKQQMILFVDVTATSLSSAKNPSQASAFVQKFIDSGWRIILVSGSGSDSVIRIFCIVLERD